MTDLTSKDMLLTRLRAFLAGSPDELQPLENAMRDEDYRGVFLLIDGLRDRGLWSPSKSDEEVLEMFWWDYAN